MKLFISAHGSVLNLFHQLDLKLRAEGFVSDSAYWISDSYYYLNNIKNFELLNNGEIDKLLEWEFTKDPQNKTWTEPKLKALEEKYGDPYLWNAIVSDRRLMHGPLCKAIQQYKCKFSHSELCEILYRSLTAIDELIEKFQPDCILSFVPASFGDYLLNLVAKARGIPYLHLKSTKIKNHSSFVNDILDNPTHIYDQYFKNLKSSEDFPEKQNAIEFFEKSLKGPLQYEGDFAKKKPSVLSWFKTVAIAGLNAINQLTLKRNSIILADNHVPPFWRAFVAGHITKKMRYRRSVKMMNKKIFDIKSDVDGKYIFYPLHSEPEIALSIYGRDHQNQIESIRRIAQSMPLNWKLVIKEHPRSIPYRSKSYFRKLLEIPNVYFADPSLHAFHVIQSAQAVVTVSGFVGMESLIIGKPLILLGDASFKVLPKTMLREVGTFTEFASTLQDLIKNYKHDKGAIIAFLAACMSETMSLNLYSELLGKSNRKSFSVQSTDEQINTVVEHFKERYNKVSATNESAGLRGVN